MFLQRRTTSLQGGVASAKVRAELTTMTESAGLLCVTAVYACPHASDFALICAVPS
jgi:hypothetical protein